MGKRRLVSVLATGISHPTTSHSFDVTQTQTILLLLMLFTIVLRC